MLQLFRKAITNLAKGLYSCARTWHERKVGEGDSFSSSTLRRRSHSVQSSLDTRRAATQALKIEKNDISNGDEEKNGSLQSLGALYYGLAFPPTVN